MGCFVCTPCLKKSTLPRICFHKSVKQCRILIKFCVNSTTSHCKQIVRFQSALVIMDLVRSPQNIRQPCRHDGQCVCMCKHETQLNSVFKLSSMCPNTSSKTWTPLPDHFVSEHLVCSHSSIRSDFSYRRHESSCDTHSCSFPLIS